MLEQINAAPEGYTTVAPWAVADGRSLAGQVEPTAALVEMRQDPIKLGP
ncbi:hypothetical protein ACFYOR_35975 [Streptomyces griseofuscus]